MAKVKNGNEAGSQDVHMILQGKGGVGKSLIAAILTEYLRAEGQKVRAITTDPVNQTLVRYESLGAEHHEIMNSDQHIDGARFDELMEEIFAADTNFVIDNGASTFLPLLNYMQENEVFELLEGQHRRLIVHNVICAGARVYDDTLKGFEHWASVLPEKRVVLWLNEYFGSLPQEKVIEEPEVRGAGAKVLGIVSLRAPKNELAARDVKALVDSCLLFGDADKSDLFRTMNRHRIGLYRDTLFSEMKIAIPVVRPELVSGAANA